MAAATCRPTQKTMPSAFLMRISIPGDAPSGDPLARLKNYISTLPHPAYGTQLHDFSVQGIPAEYRLRVTYEPKPVTLDDGTVVTLQQPTYHTDNLGYGPLGDDVMLSPRVSPHMIGLGLSRGYS